MNEVFENGHALLIGVGDDLPESVNDAQAIGNVLSDPELAGYKAENVTILVNQAADRLGIIKALDDLIAKSDENSTVFLYYSGHGGYSTALDEYHLCPNGFDLENHLPTWLSAKEFQEKVNAIKANVKVLFLDCCHAQGITSKESEEIGENAPAKKAELQKVDELGEKFFDVPNLSYISACRADQLSYILANQNNSLFTQCLIEVLRGNHRKGFDDPYIRVTETLNYLLREVPAKVPAPHVQQPAFNIRGEKDLILSFAPKLKRKDAGSIEKQVQNDDFLIEIARDELSQIQDLIKIQMNLIGQLRKEKIKFIDGSSIFKTDLQIMDEEVKKEKLMVKWKELKSQIPE